MEKRMSRVIGTPYIYGVVAQISSDVFRDEHDSIFLPTARLDVYGRAKQ